MWKDYIIFDFQKTVSLNYLLIKGPNLPSKVSIARSGPKKSWVDILSNVLVEGDGTLNLETLTRTEMLKITMDEFEGKVEVSYVEVGGCPLQLLYKRKTPAEPLLQKQDYLQTKLNTDISHMTLTTESCTFVILIPPSLSYCASHTRRGQEPSLGCHCMCPTLLAIATRLDTCTSRYV